MIEAAAVGAATADGMAVEVNLDITWADQPANRQTGNDQSVSANPQGPQTTLDLLVERAHTAAPVVIAWGPPGSGPTLTAHQNGH